MSAEFALIEEVFAARSRKFAGSSDGVCLGIGDDAALTQIPDGHELVTATDSLVAGTHFLSDAPADSVGYRSLAVNLSDLAAMGARPLWASIAINLPSADRAWLESFADGFFALAERYDVALIGGDTVRGPLAVTVTVQGSLPAGTAVLRSGAAAGDIIHVTGSPGEAVVGRLLMSGEFADGDALTPDVRTRLQDRFAFPQPRLEFGMGLRKVASAMIDVSDGLHTDLQRLLKASGKGARAVLDDLSLVTALSGAAGGEVAAGYALTGGEDYELCFTVPADCEIPACETRVTRIGEVVAGAGIECRRQGTLVAYSDSGYRHFQ